MIITIKGSAPDIFKNSNIGTLSTWSISRVLGDGAIYSGDTYIDKGAALNATVTIGTGYELGAAGVTVTMGGSPVTSGITVNGNTITIAIASVTGNVVIKVPTKNISTGEEDEGGNEGGNTPSGANTIIISESGATYTEGKTLDSTAHKLNDKTSYFVYQYIPVQPNTTYVSSDGAGRMWLLNSNKEQISTLNIWSGTPKYTFTTTSDTAYVSISYCADASLGYGEADPTTASLTVFVPSENTGGENTGESAVITLATSGAELHEGYNISAADATLAAKTDYFTYHYIPIEPSTTYLSTVGGTRAWFFDSSKTKLTTENIKNNAVPYQFTTPSNAAYVSIAYQADGGLTPVPDKNTVTLTKIS